jgi:hypothetical protein
MPAAATLRWYRKGFISKIVLPLSRRRRREESPVFREQADRCRRIVAAWLTHRGVGWAAELIPNVATQEREHDPSTRGGELLVVKHAPISRMSNQPTYAFQKCSASLKGGPPSCLADFPARNCRRYAPNLGNAYACYRLSTLNRTTKYTPAATTNIRPMALAMCRAS